MTATMDAYGEITNSPETYAAIVETLRFNRSVVVGWTDGEGSHLDVLFALEPIQFGPIRSGVCGQDHLFVGILRAGCFAFSLRKSPGRTFHHPDYVAEKLGLDEMRKSSTMSHLTVLIDGVLDCLNEAHS